SDEFKVLEYDIVLATLFLHHFKEEQLFLLLNHLLKRAKIGLVINDLHRHRLAYYLFKLISIPVKNKMICEDGLTSVLRGFKRKELVDLSRQLKVSYQLKWKWAFRYQWILWS
ncbi:MAG: methyltransferase, partial [Gelidibacter sp.]